MANKSTNKNNSKKVNNNQKNNTNSSNKKKNVNKNKNIKIVEKDTNKKNTYIMKTLVFLGVVIFSFIIIYLMYHFFVEESDIKINMSTDKQMEYITIKGQDELIMTQKYVSDLAYTMRYDVNNFKVFKYKSQDIYKNLKDERILVVVEKSILPNNCEDTISDNEYNNCYVKVDNYTEEYYLSTNDKVYKITTKSSGSYTEEEKANINYMIKSFAMTD